MLDVCLLGTGGLMPLPDRHLASMLVSCDGVSILVDCGEGTQVSMRKNGVSPYDIGLILLTHMHGDHVAGLPGVLLSIAGTERREPLVIAGPRPLLDVVRGICVIVPNLPYDVRLMPLPDPLPPDEDEPHLSCGKMDVFPFSVEHHIPCLGYRLHLPRRPAFDPRAARRLGVPIEQWKTLQFGQPVEVGGRSVEPKEVLGPPRKGITIVYATDTRPVDAIVKASSGADLLICEGMYGDESKSQEVHEKYHMLMQDAATIGARANVKELWLTHFSPANPSPEEYLEQVKEIFPRTLIGVDGMQKKLAFEAVD